MFAQTLDATRKVINSLDICLHVGCTYKKNVSQNSAIKIDFSQKKNISREPIQIGLCNHTCFDRLCNPRKHRETLAPLGSRKMQETVAVEQAIAIKSFCYKKNQHDRNRRENVLRRSA